MLSEFEIAHFGFLYATGARISEVLSLDVDDVDIDAHVVRLKEKGQTAGGTNGLARARRPVDLPGAIPVSLGGGEHTRSGGAVSQFGGRRLSRQSAWLVIKQTAEAAHIAVPVSPHVPPLIRYPPARRGRRRQGCAGVVGALIGGHDSDLHDGDGRSTPRGICDESPACPEQIVGSHPLNVVR